MKTTKVYVAGKYSADNVIDVLKNIGRGQKACAGLFHLGFAPFSPWADQIYVTDQPEIKNTFELKQKFYDASTAWLEVSDAVYVISGKGDGGGVDAEIKRAEELGIPVFESLPKLIAWKEEFQKGSHKHKTQKA